MANISENDLTKFLSELRVSFQSGPKQSGFSKELLDERIEEAHKSIRSTLSQESAIVIANAIINSNNR